MKTTDTGPHLSDAELVRYLDEGAEAAESPRWQRHIDDCPRCDEALRTVRSESRLVSDWLERAAFEAESPTLPRPAADPHPEPLADPLARPRRPLLTPWLRAAALFVLLAAPLAAFPGVRAWVSERVVGPPPATVTGDDEANASTENPTVLRFVPAPGTFVVRFDPDTEGVITIERSEEPEAELRAEGGAPEATVSTSVLRIRNPATARYRLRLPDATTGVSVMVGERAMTVSDREIDRRARLELGSG